MAAPGVVERAAFSDAMALIGAVIGAAIGLVLLVGSRDPGMAFHGLLFLLAGVVAAVFVLQGSFGDTARDALRDDANDYWTARSRSRPSPRCSGASPAFWSATSSPGSSPFPPSISTCRGRASGACGRCTPPP